LARGQPDGGSKQRQRSFSHDKIPLLIPEPHVPQIFFLPQAPRIATVMSACYEFEYSAADCSNNLVSAFFRLAPTFKIVS
jgi:hypothetical protein